MKSLRDRVRRSEQPVWRDKRYYVYILTNPSRTLYTGITSHLQQRVLQHKAKTFPGFTSKYNINRLVYFEVFEYVGNAIAREKEIKSWTRAKRVALIESKNPKWDDLSREWGKPETFRFTPTEP
jgi:putative endonuclease